MPPSRLIWILLGALVLVASYRSSSPFWIDASGYTGAVEAGRSVVHPPGYIGFLALARWVHQLGFEAYPSLQLISVASYLASIPLVHSACRMRGGAEAGLLFTGMYAFGWVSLNIAGVGTTHASDLLFGSVIAWLLCLPGRASGRWWWHPVLVLTLTVAAAFRTSTVVMFAPLVVVIFAMDFRNRWLWISGIIGLALMAAIVWATVEAYGGMENFRRETEDINALNRQAGLLTGGGWKQGGVNAVRAALWLTLAAPLLPLLLGILTGRTKSSDAGRGTGWLLIAAVSGGLLINFGYLCTHPGYFAPILPLCFAIAADWLRLDRRLVVLGAAQLIFTLLLFFVGRTIHAKGSAVIAVANSMVLQFSADTQRKSIPIRTLSEWLMDSDLERFAPDYRKQKIEKDRKRENSAAAQDQPDPSQNQGRSDDAGDGQ